jgi:hypothetical protein
MALDFVLLFFVDWCEQLLNYHIAGIQFATHIINFPDLSDDGHISGLVSKSAQEGARSDSYFRFTFERRHGCLSGKLGSTTQKLPAIQWRTSNATRHGSLRSHPDARFILSEIAAEIDPVATERLTVA